MSKKQAQQEEISEIEINAKQEPIDLDAGKPEPEIDEDNPRAAIYKKHSEKRKAEGEGTAIGTEKQETQPVEPEVQPEAQPEPEKEILVKVNGKEKMVPVSKIEAAGGIEAYRKNAAASELLNQAAAERREIEAQRAQIAQQQQQIQQERQALQSERQKPVAANAEEMKGLARKYHEAILDGDIDMADTLLVQMQATRGDSGEIAKQAAEEARAAIRQEREAERKQQFQSEVAEAVEWFESTHPDISEDAELREIADKKTSELLEANPTWRPKKIVEESARIVRDWMNDKGIGQKLPSDKLEAKRGLTVVKGGSARAVPRQTSKVPTSSQYIESLRKARGLE